MKVKLQCSKCGQHILATDDTSIAITECPNCTHPLGVPLSKERARKIVEHAENEFASGRHIEYSFTPFEAGGASSPLEALHALYILIQGWPVN